MPAPTLNQIVPGASAATVANGNFRAVAPAAIYGYNEALSSGLTWAYWGGTYDGSNNVAAGTVVVGASTTTYVVAARSNGAVSSATSTTNWNDSTNYFRVARLISNATGITTNEDNRPSPYGAASGGGGGGAVWGAITGTLSSQTDLQTALDAKQPRAPNIQTVTSASTVTPTFSNDLVKITAQAAALTLANPSGTAIDGLGMVIRIKDNGTARTIAYGTQYRPIGVTLPTTTVLSKTVYLAMIWNAEDTTWDVLAVGQQP